MKESKKKLSVEFNFQVRRVISENESSFMHECDYILRNNCSLQDKEWRLVPNEVRLPLRHKQTENAQKKVMARGKRKLDSGNGSKSTLRYHLERGQDLDSSSGQLETWRLTHWDAEKGWISVDADEAYVSLLDQFYH
ncbi:hypothetical protein L1987_63570 [Smallanthus sonchifolius]|uniref:Uncharacterized protein n=1 Tax=Smallanthus sonchifolius TaxID=185202 RepID=A0ACB9CDN0_9ASTR|nr:hypothetical protein L1987_63570 [Smallanthus sonchifolius]